MNPFPHRSWAARLLTLGFVLLALVGVCDVGLAQLTLTPLGTSRGFTLTTYASGLPNTGGAFGIGPIGIAFRTDGKVLVSTYIDSTIYMLPSHADGQVGGFPIATDYADNNNAMAIAQIQNGNQWKYYLGQSSLAKIIEIDQNGAYVQDIVPVALSGMAPYPPGGAVNGLTGHLFATSGDNIWDVDVQAKTKTLFATNAPAGGSADGLSFSPDGLTLYVAFNSANIVRAFDALTGAVVWTSPVIPAGPDGIAIGLGTLTGYVYANCVGGEVWEIGVPGGPHAGAFNLIADGGSRGDFIAVDPNIWSGGSFPSLLLTQTDRIMRMDPPGGGWFGPPTSSTNPVLCTTCFPRLCEPGAGGVIGCPCSNPPAGPARGCNNHGTETGGATLDGSGTPSLISDSVLLEARDENASSLTVFWTGQNLISPPGVAHAAGVRCVSGLHRLYSGAASGGRISRPGMTDPSVSARSAAVGAPIVAGQTRYYFTIYRDPQAATPCSSSASTVNVSNAVSAMWTP